MRTGLDGGSFDLRRCRAWTTKPAKTVTSHFALIRRTLQLGATLTAYATTRREREGNVGWRHLPDVFLDSRRKQYRLLADDADLFAQPRDVEISDVNAVDRHAADDWVVEALQKLDGRALAAAARTNQRHCAASRYRQSESF